MAGCDDSTPRGQQWPARIEGGVGPVEELVVLGQPAHVVRTDHGSGYEGW